MARPSSRRLHFTTKLVRGACEGVYEIEASNCPAAGVSRKTFKPFCCSRIEFWASGYLTLIGDKAAAVACHYVDIAIITQFVFDE